MPRIKSTTKWITAVETLQILCFWRPEFPTKPNADILKPIADKGDITRVKVGNRFMYDEDSVREYFDKKVS